jgi:acyl carrier protein
MEFLGRADEQVKLRGFRVELGEIEAALRAHPSLREAAVMAREDGGGERRLVAYVVGGAEGAPGADELRGFLRAKLPEYMIPARFVWLDSLPLTPNGKVDRRALPAPRQESDGRAEDDAAPLSPFEEAVAAIWSEVLGVERVGPSDNFFQLGGHSLMAARVLSRVGESLRVELPLRSLFDTSNLAEFAMLVEDALLTLVENLSDDEARRRLG